MILTVLLSFIAGILTVLAPCVLPFLPIIVGGSIQGAKWRPYLVCASLVISLVVFSILLKATSALLFIDPNVWTSVSGIIVICLGLTMLFPALWAKISSTLRLSEHSHEALEAARHKKGLASAILTGAALGPVFSSCSPTYAWVLATILPKNFAEGLVYLAIYCVGLSLALLAISLLGRALISKIRFLANPYGIFQRSVALIFIIVGLLITTGVDKRIQVALSGYSSGLSDFEQTLLPDQMQQSATLATSTNLNVSYPAPEFSQLSNWINSEPLRLEDLKGKVVLVDFWTYSCINCIRTQPYLNAWHNTYKDKGLVIVGIHAPEFAFEKVPANVQKAVIEAGIHYPVALDNNFATWQAYNNHYWPAKYLIDQEGRIRYTHFGEGDYDATEQAIQELLGQNSSHVTQIASSESAKQGQSPETYLGEHRASGYLGSPQLTHGTHTFQAAPQLSSSTWTLSGTWLVEDEYIESQSDGARLSYRFSGRVAHLVMSADQAQNVTIEVGEGEHTTSRSISVQEDKLYDIATLSQASPQTLVTLTFDAGVKAYAFTFGS